MSRKAFAAFGDSLFWQKRNTEKREGGGGIGGGNWGLWSRPQMEAGTGDIHLCTPAKCHGFKTGLAPGLCVAVPLQGVAGTSCGASGFHVGTCRRSWTETHEGSRPQHWLGPWIRPKVKSPPPALEHRAESPRRKRELASIRRRMRAVTGSSAEICFCRMRCGVASMLCAGLEGLDLFGQFGGAGLRVAARLGCLAGKAGFELVAQFGEFREIGVVQEGGTEAGLIIPQLRLGDCQLLPDAVAFGAVATGHAFQGVQHGTRPLVFPRELGLTGDGTFQVHIGRELRMKAQAEIAGRDRCPAERGSSRGR